MTTIPIGRFAALARLSERALRLYDERGLLRPATVDPETGRRGYASAQVADARTIRLLRLAGVPLEAIGRVLAGEADAAGVLDAHLEAERAAHAQRLAVAGVVRRQLAEPPDVRGVAAVALAAVTLLAVTHEDVAVDDLGGLIGREIHALLDAAGDAVAGPPRVTFLRPVDEGVPGAVEIAVEVGTAVRAPGATLREEPGGEAAGVRLEGAAARWPDVLAAYEALPAWAAAQGRDVSGAPWEAYPEPGVSEVRWRLA